MADVPALGVNSFGGANTPELNQAILDQLKKQIELKKQQDIAAAQGSASARGISGSSFEANQIGAANRTATDAETNAAVQLAIQQAAQARDERLTKEGRDYQTSERVASQAYGTSERVGSEDFAAKQNKLQQDFQDLELQKQQAFAAGETEKAQKFQAQQDELSRQFQAGQQISQNAFTSGQNAKQRKVDTITGISTGIGQVGGMIVGACFVGTTLIDMADGSQKMIKDIRLGDATKGGIALSWRQAVSNHMYNYHGVMISAAHAIKTKDGWKRAMQCEDSIRVPGIFPVYNLVTPEHRIFINGIEFTDEFEFDDPYQPLADSLKRLNEAELAKVGK
jgi:hypothetical protein